MMPRPMRYLLFICLIALGLPRTALAKVIVGVVSSRSSAEMAAAAALFARLHPGHSLRLRTPEQLSEMTDQAVANLWQDADALLLAGIFGEDVPRIERLLREKPMPTHADLLAFHADLRLTRASRTAGESAFSSLSSGEVAELTRDLGAASDWPARLQQLAQQHPQAAQWLAAKGYWQAGGTENLSRLLAWLALHADRNVPPFIPRAPIRYLIEGQAYDNLDLALKQTAARPIVPVLDYDFGDRAGDRDIHAAIANALARHGLLAVGVLARWGNDTVQALQTLQAVQKHHHVVAVVSLQDFVLGGSEGRVAAAAALEALDRPVIKAIRLDDRSEVQWRHSHDGLPADSVHYRVAMPEVQGASQPLVVAAVGPTKNDALTGLRVRLPAVLQDEVAALADKVLRWHVLQTKPVAERKVALVYYNHPPGRHNVGADNLDVPATLLQALRALSRAGYATGTLPANEATLLAAIQARGINLPEDRQALAHMAAHGITMTSEVYRQRFAQLPTGLQAEVEAGPLAALAHMVQTQPRSVGSEDRQLQTRVVNVLQDVRQMLEGLDHPARPHALTLMGTLQSAYVAHFADDPKAYNLIKTTTAALRATGVEGVRGWGAPPGKIMTANDRLLIPGLRFGNVFIGPQPPRGWEVHEELLHANMAFPPHHQYLAFYEWLRKDFQADVVVHVGRHSTYEFLPGRSVGLPHDDAARVVMGDVPSVYIYIVDGVGEGIQAKRRGHAVIVDHLTPPLATTALYDELLELRQLVETYEARADQKGTTAARAVATLRQRVGQLNLKQELVASMKSELDRRGIGFDDVDDDLLVHEVGHYLTSLQEQFMPFGLHVFGQNWKPRARQTMLRSMGGDRQQKATWSRLLQASPAAEMHALLHALKGGFVPAGPGNDPIRSPDVLPTGRNFHALDGGVLPTKVGYAVGRELGDKARADALAPAAHSEQEGHAVVLWASDTVRDEGAMVAFGLDLLGARPVWNSRGIVTGVERVPLANGRQRLDTTFVTSGLFRDLYGSLLHLADRAVLTALDGASRTLLRDHPDVQEALENALRPLGEARQPGDESLADNRVAARWLEETRKLLAKGMEAERAGRYASVRVFGNAPGGYGAGVNRLVERSGAWSARSEVADAYITRMGHAYGADLDGVPLHPQFMNVLRNTGRTFLGRASNLYGLLDNNDGFDYLGGLSMAVERVGGVVPSARVIRHANSDDLQIDGLDVALFRELRGRHLNPLVLQALMAHGYAGARTMGNNAFEYLWGWQVSNPELVKPWVWDEVRSVYLQDRHSIGVRRFLERDHNVHVLTNMHAVLLVAAHKGFWQPDAKSLQQVARDFADLVIAHGLPGSGHTKPDHPMMPFVSKQLAPEQRQAFDVALAAALVPPDPRRLDVVSEGTPPGSPSVAALLPPHPWPFSFGMLAVVVLLVAFLATWLWRRRQAREDVANTQS